MLEGLFYFLKFAYILPLLPESWTYNGFELFNTTLSFLSPELNFFHLDFFMNSGTVRSVSCWSYIIYIKKVSNLKIHRMLCLNVLNNEYNG